ncbi:choice-of-anchor I family protein [Cohnella sp.]|uniref:choice-of-anchor I family protein n=1 Tax=Cohnella sp. TaxID=1883426 RepID=UPI003569F26A
MEKMSIFKPKRVLSWVLTVCMTLGLFTGTAPFLQASTPSGTALANMVYLASNAAAEYDRAVIPGSSHFTATSGEFRNDSRLTAWSENQQVLIGYAGSNRTPVVLNNGSLSANGWQSADSAMVDADASVANASAFQIQFKTAGYENIKFSSSQKSTKSGPESFALAYSIDNPAGPFTPIAGSKINAPKEAATDAYSDLRPAYTDFPLPAELNDKDEVYLRVYLVDSAVSGTKNGNTSINDIVITGDATAGGAVNTELMGLKVEANNAAAAFDYEVIPGTSHFTATGGLYPDNFKLTAWSENQQVLIGYAGSNRTPVVLNNGSLSANGWQSADSAMVDADASVANASAFQIQFKTAGYENIKFSSSQKSTKSGPESFALAYSIGNPTGPFTPIAGSKINAPKEAATDAYSDLRPVYTDFSLPAELNDKDEVYLRVYLVDSAISGTKNGNTSINDIVITGDAIGSGGTPLTESMISAIAGQAFKGAPIEPAVIVTDGGTPLIEGEHYTLSYSNNTNVGTTAQVTVTAKPGGGYSGSASRSFAITSALPATYSTMLTHLGSYSVGDKHPDGGVAEIVAYNKDNQKMYVISGTIQALDIVSLADIKAGQLNSYAYEKRVNMASIGTANGFSAGDMTSVSINTRLKAVAVSVQHPDYDKSGYIVFLDYDGNYIAHYEAGIQPDMIGFSPDNNYAMTANEGERRNFGPGSVDPKGSVTIVDLRSANNPNDLKNLATDKLTTVYFDNYDAPEARAQLVTDLVLLKAGTAPSVDLEPEYIAFSKDNLTAYVSLQEANAVATFDMATKTFTSIKGLGFKDHSQPGNELDFRNDGSINIKKEPVFGVYMPDGLATVNIGGVQYVLTPNEGESRSDWAGYKDINEGSSIPGLGNVGSAEWLINSERDVLKDRPDDLFTMGGRSFSIWKASDMSRVYDSGSDFERITAEVLPTIFNAHHRVNGMEARSPRKGPEPEDIKVLQVGSKIYTFIGLERIGGLMMYDITNPAAPVFVDYFNNRNPSKTMDDNVNDLGAEGISVISAEDSPTGWPMVLVANEVSGTVTVLQINEGYTGPSDAVFNIEIGQESLGGIGYKRAVSVNTADISNTAGMFLLTKVTETATIGGQAVKTVASSIVSLRGDGRDDIFVTYTKPNAGVEVWLLSGSPDLVGTTIGKIEAYNGALK